MPVRIHALLDDASRYVVALRVRSDERETTMIALLSSAVLGHGIPEVLYLDNGSTYRGESLSMYCARLQSSLLHARPYDPQARGKMEALLGHDAKSGPRPSWTGQLAAGNRAKVARVGPPILPPRPARGAGRTDATVGVRDVPGEPDLAVSRASGAGVVGATSTSCPARRHAGCGRRDLRGTAWFSRRSERGGDAQPSGKGPCVAGIPGETDPASSRRSGRQRTQVQES